MELYLDRLTNYCPIRRQLEQRSLNLVERLAVVTDRLMRLIGRDGAAFADAKAECGELRTGIVEARRDAQEHRLEHGC